MRNGIRRLTFRTERDNKEQPMAIVLVDIQVLDLEEVNKRIERCTTDLEASLFKCSALLYLPTEAKHNQRLSLSQSFSLTYHSQTGRSTSRDFLCLCLDLFLRQFIVKGGKVQGGTFRLESQAAGSDQMHKKEQRRGGF